MYLDEYSNDIDTLNLMWIYFQKYLFVIGML